MDVSIILFSVVCWQKIELSKIKENNESDISQKEKIHLLQMEETAMPTAKLSDE